LVAERDPIARVFTIAGKSFYIDSAGMRMPLLPGVSARLPVITGFPAAKKLNQQDSALLRAVTGIAQYVNENRFWQAQIAQIDITPAGTFELMPVIGNHIIRIGNAENLEEKLDRLFLFYKQVLTQTGFDKYGIVDVQFNNQVIGIKSKITSAVDSIQLQKNIEELIERTKLQATADSMALVQAKEAALQKDTAVVQPPVTVPVVETKKEVQTSNKKQVQSNVVEKTKSTNSVKQPKAVMSRVKKSV
jgi:cell division protein FtsQ